MKSPEDLAQKLKLQAGDPVLRIRRLRLADSIPMAIEESHIPLKQFPGLERINFAKQSLYSACATATGSARPGLTKHRSTARDPGRIRIVDHLQKGKRSLDFAHPHDNGRDTYRGHVLEIPRRPVPRLNPRPYAHDHVTRRQLRSGQLRSG